MQGRSSHWEKMWQRESQWSQGIAAGSEALVNQVADAINPEFSKCKQTTVGKWFVVREPVVSYHVHFDSKMDPLSPQNTLK